MVSLMDKPLDNYLKTLWHLSTSASIDAFHTVFRKELARGTTHAHAMVGRSALGVKMTRSQTNAEVDRRSTTTPRPTQLPSVSAPSPAIGVPAWSFPSPQPTGAHHTTHTHH